MRLKTYELRPPAEVPIQSAVIFLHGYGDKGSGGLLDIGRMWQTSGLPNTVFVCPDAPLPLENAPPELEGRQWFPLYTLSSQELSEGVRHAAPLLESYIDEIIQHYKLSSRHVALVGFSQGSMMALHVGIRRTSQLAGIIGYSGLLADSEHLSSETKSRPPVFLVHGTEDDRIPFISMAVAAKELTAIGIDVQTLPCPHLGHSIDNVGLRAGMAFLKAHLASTPSAQGVS